VRCPHPLLVALPPEPKRLRCTACHLTITEAELAGGPCPECYEARGERAYAFEEIAAPARASTGYRCDQCGILIA
jgi:predicted RNA-binding Zn-ribbon protein involved in translation (DUF1610 family)